MNMKIHPPQFLLAASATGLLALAAVLPAQADYSNTVETVSKLPALDERHSAHHGLKPCKNPL
jgi:hypothetical protein